MLCKPLLGLLVAVGLSLAAAPAQAQLDMSHLVYMNMQFDAQMQQQAANFAQNWYEARQQWRRDHNYWGHLPAPFDASDLNRANLENQAQFERNTAAWHARDRRQSAAVGNWTRGAIRGEADYVNPHTGEVQSLPYTTNPTMGYWRDAWGRIHYGQVPHHMQGTNFFQR